MGKLRRDIEKSARTIERDDSDLPAGIVETEVPAEILESGEMDPSDVPGIDTGLKDWFLKNNLQDTEYRVSLYRYINPNFGERKTLVYQYTDEIPSEHEIGLKYGAGRYCLYVCLTDNRGKRRIYHSKFRLADEYDQLKNNIPVSTGPALSGGNGYQQMDSAFNMITKVMQLILPVISASNNNNNHSDTRGYFDMMVENYKSTNEILKRNTLDNSQFLNDIQRRATDMPEILESADEVNGVTGFINSIAPLIEKFLPFITGKSNIESKAVLGIIKGSAEYNQVVKDKQKVNALLGFIRKKHGNDIAEKVIKKLGIIQKP